MDKGIAATRIGKKLEEIRYQLKCNVEIIMRDYPDPKPRLLPHEIEILTGHVYDRLTELEEMLTPPKEANQ